MTKTLDDDALLHLQAMDAEDLAVLSANLQDARVVLADIAYLPAEKRFALVGKRFDWAKAAAGGCERCVTGLHFERVLGVTRSGLKEDDGERVLNLLAIEFQPGEAPGGQATLTFSGGAAIRLTLECVEAQMRDIGPRTPCERAPAHPLER